MKNKLFVPIIIILLIITGFTLILYINKSNNIKDLNNQIEELNTENEKLKEQKQEKEEYIKAIEDKYGSILLVNIDDIGVRKLKDTIGHETFILVISQTSCSHCERYLPKLDIVLREKKLKAYNIDLANLSMDEYNMLQTLVDFESTPTTVIFKKSTDIKYYLRGDKDRSAIEKFIEEHYYGEE